MNNFLKRLLLFIIGIPALIAAIALFPEWHLPVWNLALITLAGLGAVESRALFGASSPNHRGENFLLFLSGAVLPSAAYLQLFIPDTELLLPIIAGVFLLQLLPLSLIGREESIKTGVRACLHRFSASIYPGFFLIFLVLISGCEAPRLKLFLFFSLVFGNDTFAYIFGKLFGKYSVKVSAVSPNKTLIGFIGGFLGSSGLGCLIVLLLPETLSLPLPWAVLFFFSIAIASNIGDLVESAFKRSAGIKDSGSLMLGRGGVLDSSDSILFSAPIFYYIVSLFS